MQPIHDKSVNNAEILFILKKKEAEVNELVKIKKKYECELEIMNEKYIEKEYRLKRTEEENVKLKEKLSKYVSVSRNTENFDFPSEILKLKAEIRMLREKKRENERVCNENTEKEVQRLNGLLLDSEAKYNDLLTTVNYERKLSKEAIDKNKTLSEELHIKNQRIEDLELCLDELNEEILIFKQENLTLSEVNSELNQRTAPPDYPRIKSDAEAICKQTVQNFLIIEALHARKDIASISEAVKDYSETDLNKTFSETKKTLIKTKEKLIEIYADTCGDSACIPQ